MLKKTLPLDTLQILDALDREGSFATAAVRVNRSISAISYQIQKLEDELDVLLLDRSGHRATFTKAGEFLLDRGRLLLKASDDTVSALKEVASGWEETLSISYDGIVGQEQILKLVKILSDTCITQLKTKEEILVGGWEALIQERTDILISSHPSIELPGSIKVKKVGEIEMIWVASNLSPILSELAPTNDAVRKQYKVVAVADSAVDAPKATKNILYNQPVFTVGSMQDKLSAIKANIGIGTLPRNLIKHELNSGELIEFCLAKKVDLVVAWKRAEMGRAKSLCIKTLESIAV
ncbi:LysR family transcriptional regulator [Vibrio lamellibrachiae]|uniref:LysR family transcriptional regulator n=1 Tax=Vibrio lamellibrachiae TaxID=2910253 RepID=UPI003D103BB6